MTCLRVHLYHFVTDTVKLILAHVLVQRKLDKDKSCHVKCDTDYFKKSFQIALELSICLTQVLIYGIQENTDCMDDQHEKYINERINFKLMVCILRIECFFDQLTIKLTVRRFIDVASISEHGEVDGNSSSHILKRCQWVFKLHL